MQPKLKPQECNYWVTVQWPYRVDQDLNIPRSEVYLRDGLEAVGADLRPDDLVAVYETKDGRHLIRKDASGEKVIKYHRGQEGIVALLKVTTELRPDETRTPEHYTKGPEILWKWYAAAKQYSTGGFVSRQDLNDILTFDPNYKFYGFGDRKSGLKKITKKQFFKISELFTKGSPQED